MAKTTASIRTTFCTRTKTTNYSLCVVQLGQSLLSMIALYLCTVVLRQLIVFNR